MTTTLASLIDTHGVDVLDHLNRQMTIPAIAGMQRQGDVLVVPNPSVSADAAVPAAGVPVVRGEAGGNTHLLVGEGDVRCDLQEATTTDLTLAILTVAEGATAYLTHPEHGYIGISPGSYTIRRQREQADELRMVAD